MRLCPFCGKKLILKTLLDESREKYCQSCAHVFFDTPSPAIIVAVIEEDRVVLTRSVEWKHTYWGLIAGHVKSGETAEEAVIREVREEVSLEITDLTILGTSIHNYELLMIEFTAKKKSGNITKAKELKNAMWFRLAEPLPLRPNSIASKVVTRLITDERYKT